MAERILCIEDNYEMRKIILMTLESEGFETDEAEDGRKGLNRALEMPPDLIICDIQMPGLDGYETLEELRKHESTSQIPFIFLTGVDPKAHFRKGMNLGADDFISKPFDVDDLIRAVKVRLQKAERRKKEAQHAIDDLSEKIMRALPHELRTPMTGILGLAELLSSQAEELGPLDVKDLAQSLFESAVRMNQTLDKFWIHTQCLILSRDSNKITASSQTGTKEADKIIQHIAVELANNHNRSSDLCLNLLPIYMAIAEQYLEQILRQIIDNAFKFSSSGSKVIISMTAENNLGTIVVQDNGRGMSEDQIHKINTFMQFDREQYEQQGLGLGLMIARRLTKIHNGGFNISSSPQNGLTISLSFPMLSIK
jgi:signal transduction histidine kinase